MPRSKLIIFDLDGILVETSKLQRESFYKAFNLFGYYPDYPDHHAKPTKWSMDQLGVPEILRDYLAAARKGLILQEAPNEIRPFDVHLNALRDLKAMGYFLAVCSNAEAKVVDYFLDLAGMSMMFDSVICRDRVKHETDEIWIEFKTKPDPAMLIDLAETYRDAYRVYDCTMVGDSDTDYGAAEKAEMPFIRSTYSGWVGDLHKWLDKQ